MMGEEWMRRLEEIKKIRREGKREREELRKERREE